MTPRAPRLSDRVPFEGVDWATVPDLPGVYVIYDRDEALYVGMAGRNGKGSLRNRLRDHASGQMVNMFAQYLYFARVQFVSDERITHPRDAKVACRRYIADRCAFAYRVAADAVEARAAEARLRRTLAPALNGL